MTNISRTDGRVQTVTLGANVALNIADGLVPTDELRLIISQDATGNRVPTFSSNVKFAQGGLTLSTAANAVDSVNFMWDGVNWQEVGRSIGTASTYTPPDATNSAKGVVQLAGDLSGTAAAPTVPGLSGKEPTILAGLASQYWRGDKTFQTLDKIAVGLNNVDNTSDANKPVSTAVQTALDAKLNLAGGTLTGPLITATSTSTSAALRIPTGALLSTGVSGTIENDGATLYYTNNGNTRLSLVTTTSTQTITSKTLTSPTITGSGTYTSSGAFTATGSTRLGYFSFTATPQTIATTSPPFQMANAASNAIVINLPSTTNAGTIFTFKKIDSSANTVTIKAGTSGTIDANNTYVLSTQYKYVTVISTTTSDLWYITGNN